MYTCPQCGKDLETDTCECGFDINETLGCPYKISGNCIHTHIECNINGLGYEECGVYLHKSGIEV